MRSNQLAVLSAGDASVGLVAPGEDAPVVDALNFWVDSETSRHGSRFYPRHLATAVNARHWLASPPNLVQAPFLSHRFNHTLFRIVVYNRLGKFKTLSLSSSSLRQVSPRWACKSNFSGVRDATLSSARWLGSWASCVSRAIPCLSSLNDPNIPDRQFLR